MQVLAGLTVYQAASLAWCVMWLTYTVAAWLASQVLSDDHRRRVLMIGAAMGGAILAAFGTAQHLAAPGTVYGIVGWEGAIPFATFFNRNHYAAMAELLLPMALYLCFTDARRRWWWGAAAGTVYGSVLLSGSRAGAVLVTAELLFANLRLGARHPRRVLVLLTACTAATLLAGGERIASRLREPEPLKQRALVLRSAIQMWRARPWTGFGGGTFEAVYPEYALFDVGRRVDHAHNDWAEWLAEGGVPLTLMMAAFFTGTLANAWRHPWSAGAAVVLLHSLVDFPMQIPAIALGVAVTTGAAGASCRTGPDAPSPRARRGPRR
jgi:O-antigen ligase